MLLRTLALSLLAANLLFFAWTQGWIGRLGPVPPALQGREPERLDQQLRPESLTVLRPRAVAAALSDQGASAPAGKAPAATSASGAASVPASSQPLR